MEDGETTSSSTQTGWTWHRLIVNKSGDRIRCAIDGQCPLNVDESRFPANGPSLSAGRIGLRHMQKTRVRYRNLRVFTRDPVAWTDG